ncbi:MAG: MFS transporter [Sphingomonadales bacterium]|jgi:MFS family permease
MTFSENKWGSITLISIAQVLSLSLWFSATATIPSLQQNFEISSIQTSFLSSFVTIGFIIGTIISALFGLADLFPPKKFFIISTIFASLINICFLFVDPSGPIALLIRFLTGVSIAGIYPIGIKMVVTWTKGDTGFLVGLLVGALTLGSATPHLINGLGGLNWEFTIKATTLAALLSAPIIYISKLGPEITKAPPFNPKAFLGFWRNKPLRLANFGYFGHMWELYAMWIWIGSFMFSHYQIIWPGDIKTSYLMAGLTTFLIIGSGSLGCLLGGYFADKHGRTIITMGAMLISGTCALTIGFFFGGNPIFLFIVALVWGISIVADSAQFSSAVVELSEPEWRGTMLTIQTCVGFSITLISIHIIPIMVNWVGWSFAFMILAPGAYLGVWAMYSLRKHPKSNLLANGKK